MRDYAKISPAFWTGRTGRKLRGLGPECQLLALYLITSHHATMLGLYYLPLAYVHNDTGLTLEGALEGLRRLSEAGFCLYDDESEWVFVLEMARFQVLTDGEPLNPKDKRVMGIQKDYRNMPENPYLRPFFDRYARFFHLESPRGNPPAGKPPGSPLEAPSMPGAGAGAGTGYDLLATRAGEREVSRSELMIRQCVVDHADFIAEHFACLDIVLETEELVAKYSSQSIGADPWLIVLRWLRNKEAEVNGKRGPRDTAAAAAVDAAASAGGSLTEDFCSRPSSTEV